ncbi:MAG: glycosyltransferase family 4 protein [Candidatus Omnitrophota bacterium]|nr:glycosyltransferase family 4 protein [Candidatus Omnitrophota bacterium]
MKILLLTTHLNTGGIGVYTANLARYLKKDGLDVSVASSGGDLENVLREDGIPHYWMDIKTKAEFGIKVWKALPAFVTLVREGAFQLVHAQTRVAQVLAFFSGKFTAVPFVSTCHGFFKHRRLSRVFLPCWGEKIIAISDSVQRHLLEEFDVRTERVVRIYNGIELERYLSAGDFRDHGLKADIGLDGGTTVVGAIGRLSPVKGFKYLIGAFGNIAGKRPDMRLLIVGKGPEKDALERQIRELGIAGKVLLISGDRPLEKYLSILDIFCLPSVHEGLGLSLMEAMAAGRACIASDVGGLPELIKHEENGLLVPSGDPGALSSAILRLAEDSPFRRKLAEKAREKAAVNFSIVDSAAGTAEVYKAVIGG